MIYLAVPIFHADPRVVKFRVEVATRAATLLHDAAIPVFSPATHGYGFASLSSVTHKWDYWSQIDLERQVALDKHMPDVSNLIDIYRGVRL